MSLDWRRWWPRWRAALTGRNRDADFEHEMQEHLELATEENIRRGLPPGEARRQAALALGNLGQLEEKLWEERGMPQWETLWQDVRYGWRTLRANTSFTLAAVLTLALGIGANATIFSVVNAVFLKPIPYPEPDRLVNVWRWILNEPGERGSILSAPMFHEWERQNTVFSAMGLFDSAGKGYNLAGSGTPELVPGLRTTASAFEVLGVKPLLGRTYTREEETLGKHRVVVLSHSLWQRRFAGDRSLVGRAVRIDGAPYTVIGVMPPGFEFDFFSSRNQLWVPAGFDEGDRVWDSHSWGASARLKPGVTLAQAKQEMDIIGRRLAAAHPDENRGESASVTPMNQLGTQGQLRDTLIALSTLAGFVLLIACVNIANLLLARGAGRGKEFALRLALGASRGRVVRQLLTESMLLSLMGALAGLAAGYGGMKLLEQVVAELPRLPGRDLQNLEVDTTVFAFALGLCVLTGVVFGLVSAYGVLSGKQVNTPLKEGGGRGVTANRGRLRQALAAVEVALALALMVGAGLMLESLSRMLNVEPGFDTRNVMTLGMALPQKVLYNSPPDKPAFCRELSERVGAVPGVVRVGAISHLPMRGNAGRGFVVEGQPEPGPDDQPSAAYGVACPGYFGTMSIGLKVGREFRHDDTATSLPVAIVNESMARKYWKGLDPVGRRFKLGRLSSTEPWITVVGVTRDVRHDGLDEQAYEHFWRPYPQAGWPSMSVVVKTAGEPLALARPVKKALELFDSDQGTSEAGTMAEVVARSASGRRGSAQLLTAFGLLALVLSGVGIAGVAAYSVAQRTHEIGIRMALGASAGEVRSMVMRGSLAWTLGGIVLGLPAGYGVARLLGGMLFGVGPFEPWVFARVAVLLVLVAAGASYLPARRASQVDPVTALRSE